MRLYRDSPQYYLELMLPELNPRQIAGAPERGTSVPIALRLVPEGL
jgi:hypothetical protein